MLSFTGSLKVWVCVSPCDMRRGFEGLAALVGEQLKEDLGSGALFVFCNKRHTRLKVLAKRLEKGTFSWPRVGEVQEGKILLAPEAFAMLTDGVDLHGAKMRPWYRRD